jgi:hypothetical protein
MHVRSHVVALVVWTISTATAAVADPGPSPVVSITVEGYASNGPRAAETVDLVTREIVDANKADASKPLHRRALDDDEVAALRGALRGIALVERAKPGEGGPPGGSTSWTVRTRDGATRILAEADGAPSGARFVVITREQSNRLGEAWPDPRGKKQPPSIEQKIKGFLSEALFGPSGSPRDVAKSLARLDPDHTQFELSQHIQANTAVSLQLRAKVAVRGEVLAHELEVAAPIAYLVDQEHGVWTLADKATGKPVKAWRGAELDVRLIVDAKGRRGGRTAPIEGTTVDSVFLILVKDYGQ